MVDGKSYYNPDRLLPSTYTLGHGTHRWSGWPGAYCLLCGCPDLVEYEIADDPYEVWVFHSPAIPFCPHVPFGVDPYTIQPPWLDNDKADHTGCGL